MRELAFVLLVLVVECQAQPPFGWNYQSFGGFQQPPPFNPPPFNSYPPSYNQYPQNQPSYNQYPQNQPSYNQYPQNQPGYNQHPQRANSCYAELQRCFDQLPEYWAAHKSIDNNPTLTKNEIGQHKKQLLKRLPDNIQKCYKEAEQQVNRCTNQQNQRNKSGLTSGARSAFDKIKRIRDNKKITKQQEHQEIQRILQRLNPSISNELLSRLPELRQQFNSFGQPLSSFNSFGQQPFNQEPNPFNQRQNYPYFQ